MDEFVLKAKSYQIFLSLSLPFLLIAFVPSSPLIKIIIVGVEFAVWAFVLGRALNSRIPRRYQLNETFLIVNLFAFTIIFTLIVMFLDHQVNFIGSAVLIPIYMVFSFCHLFYFASKALTTAEKRRRTALSEHMLEMLLLMIGYFGIWLIQPRINQVFKNSLRKDDYKETKMD